MSKGRVSVRRRRYPIQAHDLVQYDGHRYAVIGLQHYGEYVALVGLPKSVKKALTEAVQELSIRYGQDPAGWHWGQEHTATFRNQTLGESGVSFIEDLFNRGPFATGGGEAIVDATDWSVIDGYEVNWLPSMRMIVDLSNLKTASVSETDAVCFIDPTAAWLLLNGSQLHGFAAR